MRNCGEVQFWIACLRLAWPVIVIIFETLCSLRCSIRTTPNNTLMWGFFLKPKHIFRRLLVYVSSEHVRGLNVLVVWDDFVGFKTNEKRFSGWSFRFSLTLTSVVGSYSFIVADAKWIENGRYVDVAKHAATTGAESEIIMVIKKIV